MTIHHIFIFTETPTAAAEELLAFGLLEGSSRVHAGQGTANRKFYFENFFLEVLWVQNAAELHSPVTGPSQLWQRAAYREYRASPFGLCLDNTPATDAVFRTAARYQPAYLPASCSIDVLAHGHNLSLPWTFRLPRQSTPTAAAEPTHHPNGLQQLTQAAFGLAQFDAADEFVRVLAGHQQLQFVAAPLNNLALTFDDHRRGKTQEFASMDLVIHY